MQIAQAIEKLNNINTVSIMMGTPPNKEILINSKMLVESGKKASENDLIIDIDVKDNLSIESAIKKIKIK